MQILKSYIAAVNPNNEMVGIVIVSDGGHEMMAMDQFIPERETPYFWGGDEADRLSSAVHHYQEFFFGESIPSIREKHRNRVSHQPWNLVIRQATIEL